MHNDIDMLLLKADKKLWAAAKAKNTTLLWQTLSDTLERAMLGKRSYEVLLRLYFLNRTQII